MQYVREVPSKYMMVRLEIIRKYIGSSSTLAVQSEMLIQDVWSLWCETISTPTCCLLCLGCDIFYILLYFFPSEEVSHLFNFSQMKNNKNTPICLFVCPQRSKAFQSIHNAPEVISCVFPSVRD